MTRLALILAFGLLCAGCNHHDRSRAAPYVVEPETPAPPPPPPPPAQEATEGRLAQAHVAVVGIGSYPLDEPYASAGRWVTTPRGVYVWVPEFARYLEAALLAEVDTALPRHDRLYAPDPTWISARPGTRIVVVPGIFSLRTDTSTYSLAAGLTAWDAWHDPQAPAGADRDHDVLYVSWRWTGKGPYLPALAHELAHSWSRSWLGEGPPGAP